MDPEHLAIVTRWAEPKTMSLKKNQTWLCIDENVCYYFHLISEINVRISELKFELVN